MLRNILTLLGGSGAAQLINVLAIPLVTQLYSPSDFGTFSVFIAVATLFCCLSTGRYELAVMLPEKDSRAWDLVRLTLWWCLAVCGLLAAGLLLYHPHPLAWLVPPFLLATGVFAALSYWLNRQERYRVLSAARVAQAGATMIAWLGLARWSALGLIAGNILGWVVGTLALVVSLRPPRERGSLAAVAREYRSFPMYAMPAGTLHFLSNNLPFFLFGAFYPTAEVGQFSLAFRALVAVMTVPQQAFLQVLTKELTRQPDRPRFYLRQLFLIMLLIGALVAPVIAAGPWLFSTVFGEKWSHAGEIGRWLALWVIVSFSVETVAYVFSVAGRNAVLAAWRGVYVVGLGLLFWAYRAEPLVEATRAWALYAVVAYAALAWLGWRAAREVKDAG